MSELLFISLASVFLLLSEPCRNSFLSDLPFSFSSLCVVIVLFHLPKWRSSSILSRPDGWRRWSRGKEHLFSMRCFKKTLSVGEPWFFSLLVLRPVMVLFIAHNTKYDDEKKGWVPPSLRLRLPAPPLSDGTKNPQKRKGVEVREIRYCN